MRLPLADEAEKVPGPVRQDGPVYLGVVLHGVKHAVGWKASSGPPAGEGREDPLGLVQVACPGRPRGAPRRRSGPVGGASAGATGWSTSDLPPAVALLDAARVAVEHLEHRQGSRRSSGSSRAMW